MRKSSRQVSPFQSQLALDFGEIEETPTLEVPTPPRVSNPALERVLKVFATGKRPPWGKIRTAIFLRDGGRCWLCAKELDEMGDFECGHIVDRVAGGSDHPDNLLSMCHICNYNKPVHQNAQEFYRWAEHGDPYLQAFVRFMRQIGYVEVEGQAQLPDAPVSEQTKERMLNEWHKFQRASLKG